jgi:hypothetical protein
MKVTEYNIENKYEETPQTEDKSEEPVDLIELVRARHSENPGPAVREHENLSDVFVMQLGLCLFILLIMAAVNFLDSEITNYILTMFRKMTNSQTEEIYHKAAELVMRYIK